MKKSGKGVTSTGRAIRTLSRKDNPSDVNRNHVQEAHLYTNNASILPSKEQHDRSNSLQHNVANGRGPAQMSHQGLQPVELSFQIGNSAQQNASQMKLGMKKK